MLCGKRRRIGRHDHESTRSDTRSRRKSELNAAAQTPPADIPRDRIGIPNFDKLLPRVLG